MSSILLFLKVLGTEFIAEMGDKTQLMLVAMTSKFKLRSIILGTAVAILVLNGLAVLAGGALGSVVPDYVIKSIAALAFMYFAASSIGGDEEEEEAKDSKIKFAPLAVFCTFFVAELGDKTQLTAITFGANEVANGGNKIMVGILVWLACSVGLFAADILGMLLGYLLKSKAPEGILHTLAFVVFAVFGLYTTYEATGRLVDAHPGFASYQWFVFGVVTGIFAGVCISRFASARKKKATENPAEAMEDGSEEEE